MQQKNDTRTNFIERTDRLASVLKVSLRELAEKIGVSQATLFGNRGGKIDISLKTLQKLEQAEIYFGVIPDKKTEQGKVTEPGPQWPQGARPGEDIEERIEKRFQALEGKMDAIFVVLSELRNAQKSDFRSSEKPKIRYPKGHE